MFDERPYEFDTLGSVKEGWSYRSESPVDLLK